MEINKLSKYASNEKAKTSKKIYAYLIDFFLEIILIMFFLGAVFTPILNSTSYGKTSQEGVYNSTAKLQEITIKSGLSKVDENNENIILTSEELADDYVKRTLNTYFYINNIEVNGVKFGINQTIFVENEDNFKGDPISYYFLNFKKENKIAVSNDDFDYESYFYNDVIGSERSDKFFQVYSEKPYRILNDEAANYLKKYIFENDDTDLPTTYYKDLISLFSEVRQKGIEELENNYQPYLDEIQNYLIHYENYANILILDIFLSYLTAHIILFLVFPLIFKSNITIGKRAFKLIYIKKDGKDVPFYYSIFNFLITLLKNIYAIILPIFFMYGTLGILTYPIIGSLNLFQFVIFSILLSLLSFIFSLFNKNHDSIEDFSLSLSLVLKDSTFINSAKKGDESGN